MSPIPDVEESWKLGAMTEPYESVIIHPTKMLISYGWI